MEQNLTAAQDDEVSGFRQRASNLSPRAEGLKTRSMHQVGAHLWQCRFHGV